MRILTRPNLGGPTRQAIALWQAHRDLGLRTLLVTGRVDASEDELSPADRGVPRCTVEQVLAGRAADGGWVEIAELRRGIAPGADRRAAGQQRCRQQDRAGSPFTCRHAGLPGRRRRVPA